MHRSETQLPRIPGSAILAIAFLGIQALSYFTEFVRAIVTDSGLALLWLPLAFLSATLADGIIARKRWARLTAIVWSTAALSSVLVAILVLTHPSLASTNSADLIGLLGAAVGFQGLLLFFLLQRNTRLWCNVRGERTESPLLLDEENTPQLGVFAVDDEIVLLHDRDSAGLPAGMVGTVVELPPDSGLIVVEFNFPEREQTARVALPTSELRLANEFD